jgi:hypothetical protein
MNPPKEDVDLREPWVTDVSSRQKRDEWRSESPFAIEESQANERRSRKTYPEKQRDSLYFYRKLSGELSEVRNELRKVNAKLEAYAEILGPVPDESDCSSSSSDWDKWISGDQFHVLTKEANTWVAIHKLRGILFWSSDVDEFDKKYSDLRPEEYSDILITNTSRY